MFSYFFFWNFLLIFKIKGGCNIPNEADRWDFGVGAGFYVDAEVEKWKENFRMFSYINKELHQVIAENFTKNKNVSIFGHR